MVGRKNQPRLPLLTISNMNLLKSGGVALFCALGLNSYSFAQNSSGKPVNISVDLSKTVAPMKPVWAWFGYDEPNYTYMKDGKKLLSEIAAFSPVPVYVRAHCLLCTG